MNIVHIIYSTEFTYYLYVLIHVLSAICELLPIIPPPPLW